MSCAVLREACCWVWFMRGIKGVICSLEGRGKREGSEWRMKERGWVI